MPGALVEAAFLEHMCPTLEQASDAMVAQGATHLSVVPVFIAHGGHLREDLPIRVKELEARHPGIPMRIAPAIGEVDTILSAITAWIEELHPPK
jgi:sirohydrochlorin cobaltochelatase